MACFLEIIVDNRETSLFNNMIDRDLDQYQIKISKKQLEIGDIHIIFNDNIYIYERKTMSDLISSIKDGRYKEQKLRLLASNSDSINYIIEGTDIIASNNSHSQELLTSVYYNSIYRDNIKLFFTKNINDTVTFLLLLCTKIIKKPQNFDKTTKQQLSTEYIDNCKIKIKKIDNIDKETCYLLQLSQIPGISKQIAKNIKDVYPSMNVLFKTLNEHENPAKLLMQIPNIGQQKANKIIEYLL
jgi:crossover junction endonuclease MUS81